MTADFLEVLYSMAVMVYQNRRNGLSTYSTD